MIGMLAALPAIFMKLEFLRCIELTSLGQIILCLANHTDESDDQALFFFCHMDDYTPKEGHCSRSLFVVIISTRTRAKSCRPASE